MADAVRVKIDLVTGVMEIEAPADSFADVCDRLKVFLPSLRAANQSSADGDGGTEGTEATNEMSGAASDASAKKPRRSAGGSKETYDLVDLGLDDEQRESLREFYRDKEPRTQKEQVAVIMAWLKQEAGVQTFVRNQIYSGFRTVDKTVPGKIGSVLGNMSGDGWVVSLGAGKYELTHVGEDHVKYKMPVKKTETK